MNAYLFSSIQSAAYGNLFECSTHEADGSDIVFSSMSHENEVGVMDDGEELLFTSLLNTEGLKAKFSKLATEDGPLSDANDVERLDPSNGLPLAIHPDALFDAGLISFDSDGSMMISSRLGKDTISLYGLSNKLWLRNPPTKRQEEYLQYHRKNVFQVTSVGATLRCDVAK